MEKFTLPLSAIAFHDSSGAFASMTFRSVVADPDNYVQVKGAYDGRASRLQSIMNDPAQVVGVIAYRQEYSATIWVGSARQSGWRVGVAAR
jgi:hypothetical protein